MRRILHQPYLEALDRFLKYTSKDPYSNCIEWTGATRKGYGQFGFRGTSKAVHRFSYEVFIGPIPAGYEINHKCRNKLCIAPDHLEALTPQQHQEVDRDLLRAGGKKGRRSQILKKALNASKLHQD